MRRRILRVSVPLAMLLVLVMGSSAFAEARRFDADLSGVHEVPSVQTDATGQANLLFDGEVLHYRVTVADITDVTQAHIHVGVPGQNGPVVAFLYGPADPSGPVDGGLAQGMITADDLVGPLAGEPLHTLLMQMRDGNAYVNVHTSENPGGEIRGQITPH